jgi:predicted dehydrogenase
MSNRVGVGIIGAGMISEQYLQHLTTFPDVEVLVVGDIDVARAKERAEKYGVPSSGTAEHVLNHDGVQIVVNLTIPAAHAEVSSAIIAAGKHVWTEKPLTVDRASGKALLEQAAAAGLRVGSAPDTVLGPGVQTARHAIDRGDIGVPLSASTAFQYVGPDILHPNPQFLFARGGGPLLDMGPYYVTALVHVFGAVDAVAAIGSRSRTERVVQAGPDAGNTFPVEVPTHVNLLTRFEQGGVAQSVLSFDSPLFRMGVVEITGTEGTIVVPDPNMFTGGVKIAKPTKDFSSFPPVQEWVDVPEIGAVTGRGLGLLEMARAIAAGRPHIATGDLGYHVLDTLLSTEESMERGEFVTVESTVDAVSTLPADFDPFAATL